MKRITLAVLLCLGLLGLPSVAPARASSALGGFTVASQTLAPGCASYSYAYTVTPGNDDWLLQVTVTDAAGVSQAFQFFNSGSPGDPTTGTSRFQLCSSNVHPGTFTLAGSLDLSDGTHQTETALPSVHFRTAPAPATTKKAAKHKKHHKKTKKKHHKKKHAKKSKKKHHTT